jgi:hypothetical protein
MKTEINLPIKIAHQGAIQVNNACIISQCGNLCAVEVDLKSKYADICGIAGSKIYLSSTSITLNLNEKFDANEPTSIEFPTMKDWRFFSYNLSRYTLCLCLIK